MTVSDVVVLLTIFAALFILARTGRKRGVVSIANKAALVVLILFVGYYFFAPEIKKAIQETQASPGTNIIQKKSHEFTKEDKTQRGTANEVGEIKSGRGQQGKVESTIKNKKQKRMLEDFERKKREIYERHERFKEGAERKLDDITNDP